ncbi:hypothetical protein ACWKW9_21030 [Rhizobium daejeonense]
MAPIVFFGSVVFSVLFGRVFCHLMR